MAIKQGHDIFLVQIKTERKVNVSVVFFYLVIPVFEKLIMVIICGISDYRSH